MDCVGLLDSGPGAERSPEGPGVSRTDDFRGVLAPVVFAVWALIIAVPLGYLMAGHWVPLPRLAAGGLDCSPRTTGLASSTSWRLIHVLAPECRCSRAMGLHLAERRARAGLDEEIWWLGTGEVAAELAEPLRRAGYRVGFLDPVRAAADLGVSGGPWLLARNPRGETVYSGGYPSGKSRVTGDVRDLDILVRVQRGEAVEPYPVYGCATEAGVEKALDPLRLKRL